MLSAAIFVVMMSFSGFYNRSRHFFWNEPFVYYQSLDKTRQDNVVTGRS